MLYRNLFPLNFLFNTQLKYNARSCKQEAETTDYWPVSRGRAYRAYNTHRGSYNDRTTSVTTCTCLGNRTGEQFKHFKLTETHWGIIWMF